MDIREARAEDWAAIFPFWSTIVAEGESYAYPDALTAEEARPLWMESPPWRVTVLEEDGRIVGSTKMGPNRPGRGDHVATASFMVDPEARGRGVGRRLGEEMIAWARASGYTAIQFNAVVETNLGAVRLWESLGFRIVGTVPAAFRSRRHGPVGLHVMHLPLR